MDILCFSPPDRLAPPSPIIVLYPSGRFWDVNSGEILIGGKNIKDYKIENLMNSISMVFQDVYLFEDTIENNIKFGKQNASHEEVVQAAKKARCHEFIENLPDKFNFNDT